MLAGINAEVSGTLLKTAKDESQPEARRLDAARQLVEIQSASDESARELLALITPRTPPGLASGLIEAVASGSATGAGAAFVERMPTMAPSLRAAAIRALLRRPEWTTSLVAAIENGQIRATELALDQKQALTAHPTPAIARRSRTLLARGGGLPDRRPSEGDRRDDAEGEPGRRPGRRQAGLRPAVLEVPPPRRRGRPGRPRPHRHGRPAPRRAAHPHPRPQPDRSRGTSCSTPSPRSTAA